MTILLNPDKKKSKKLWKEVLKNDGYCPIKEHIDENKCICKAFLEQNKNGFCEYGLYLKKME